MVGGGGEVVHRSCCRLVQWATWAFFHYRWNYTAGKILMVLYTLRRLPSTTIKRPLHEYQLTKHWQLDWTKKSTRLHSSRIRTACSLTVSPSMLCSGGGGVPGPRVMPGPGGGLCSQGGCLVLGVCLVPEGCLLWGGACSWGWGACWGMGWYPTMYWGRSPCGQNSWHTLLKILPCPKLRLRAVNILVVFQQTSGQKDHFVQIVQKQEYLSRTSFTTLAPLSFSFKSQGQMKHHMSLLIMPLTSPRLIFSCPQITLSCNFNLLHWILLLHFDTVLVKYTGIIT